VTFSTRLVIVALSSFVIANLITSAVLPMLLKRRLPARPSARASALLRARLLPATLATAAMVLAVASFIEFEPRAQESIGLVLQTLAGVATFILVVSAVRALLLQLATRRALRGWLRSAEPLTLETIAVPAFAVESAFPIVAVVGAFRPKLIVARSVLAACSPEELRAIFAHEQGHIAHHDNAKRALLEAAPDLLWWAPLSRRLKHQWHDATEAAADDAAGATANGRLHLAEALLTVARLAPVGRTSFVPTSALFRGEDISHRVRRLLSNPIEAAAPALPTWQRVATSGAFLIVSAVALKAVHELVETAVTFLP